MERVSLLELLTQIPKPKKWKKHTTQTLETTQKPSTTTPWNPTPTKRNRKYLDSEVFKYLLLIQFFKMVVLFLIEQKAGLHPQSSKNERKTTEIVWENKLGAYTKAVLWILDLFMFSQGSLCKERMEINFEVCQIPFFPF